MADEPRFEDPNEEREEPGYFQPAKSEGGVWWGIGVGLLLHLIQVPLAMLTVGISLIFIGLSQLVYLIPAILVYKRSDEFNVVKGLIIVGAITFLLNASCAALFFASLSNMH